MIYVKSKIDGKEIRTVITDDCFFSDCPVCGKQVHVDYEMFRDIMESDKPGETSVYCDPCSDEYRARQKPVMTRIK